jgi:ribosome maturation factor RimP
MVRQQPSAVGAVEDLGAALEPLIRAEGFRCVEVQLHGNRHTRRIRTVVYRRSGMDAAALERLARAIRFHLSLGTELGDAAIEVSSPGIDRVLKAPHEYAIFTGKAVRVLRADATEWEHAVIDAGNGDVVTLRFGDAIEALPVAMIRRAQLTGTERGE